MTSKDLKLIAALASMMAVVPAIGGCSQQAPPPPPAATAASPQDQSMAQAHSQEAQFDAQQRAKAAKAAGQ